MWSWYFLRHDNGAVAISKHFFWRCILGYLGELSQCLQLPLTWPNVKIASSGSWAYGCSLCHSVTFSVLNFFHSRNIERTSKIQVPPLPRGLFTGLRLPLAREVPVATAGAGSPVAQDRKPPRA